jgi:hypothetical protein
LLLLSELSLMLSEGDSACPNLLKVPAYAPHSNGAIAWLRTAKSESSDATWTEIHGSEISYGHLLEPIPGLSV